MYYRRSRLVWLVGVLMLVFGFYRGWLALNGPSEGDGGKVKIELALDPGKVREDARQVKQAAGEVRDRTLEKLPRIRSERAERDRAAPQ